MTTRSTEECERVANELRGYALIVEHDEITRGMLANASELVRDLARERDALLAECEEAWSTNAYNREDLATLKQQHQIEHVELVNLRAAHERLREACTRPYDMECVDPHKAWQCAVCGFTCFDGAKPYHKDTCPLAPGAP